MSDSPASMPTPPSPSSRSAPADDGSSDSEKSSASDSDLDFDAEGVDARVLRQKWDRTRAAAERYKRKFRAARDAHLEWKERAVLAEAEVKRFRGAAQERRRADKHWELCPVLHEDLQRYLNLRLTKSQYKFPHVVRTSGRVHKQWLVGARILFTIKFIAASREGDRATLADLRGAQNAEEPPAPVQLELEVVTNTGRVLSEHDFQDPSQGRIFDSEQVADASTVSGCARLVVLMTGSPAEAIFTGRFAFTMQELVPELQKESLTLRIGVVGSNHAPIAGGMIGPFKLLTSLEKGPEPQLERDPEGAASRAP